MDNMRESSNRYINFVPFSNLMNWSVTYHLERDHGYNDSFELVNFGSVIIRNRKKVELKDDELYTQVTIKLWGKGVKERTKKYGKEIGTKNQYRVSEGQFIMSKIDARNGAFGIVPKELEGAITTQDFLSYNINTDKAHPKFLKILTATDQFLKFCQSASTGTTGRRRIDEKFFLSIQIPLPSLEKQEEIVRAYDEKANEAEKQLAQADNISNQIQLTLLRELGIGNLYNTNKKTGLHFVPYSLLREWGADKLLSLENFDSIKYQVHSIEMNPRLAKAVFRGKSPKYDNEGQAFILNQKCIRWNWINRDYVKSVKDNWFNLIDRNVFTKDGDILINSTGEGTIGRAVLITKENTDMLYDSHILCLRLNNDVIDPEFFTVLFNSDYGQKQVDYIKSAKSTKQTELGVNNLKKIVMPLPDIKIQKKLAKQFSDGAAHVKELGHKAKVNKSQAISEFEQQIFKSV